MADTPDTVKQLDEDALLEAERRRFVAMIEEAEASVRAGHVVTSEELKVILDEAMARGRAERARRLGKR